MQGASVIVTSGICQPSMARFATKLALDARTNFQNQPEIGLLFGRNPDLANLSEHGSAIFAQHGSSAALVNLHPLMGENRF
jgi:hypothetical protein